MTSMQMPQAQPATSPMGFGEAIGACFSKYITFAGRARRAEYWYWILFTFLLQFGAGFVLGVIGQGRIASPVSLLISLVLFLPGLAVLARRLHDTDRSGWWWFICLTGIGAFVVLYWLCLEGTKGTNRYGPRTA